MKAINFKAWHIAKKNVKEKIKNKGVMLWTVLFPILMVIAWKFMSFDQGELDMVNGLTAFDLSFQAIIIYSIGVSTATSAVMFSTSRKDGTLERMDSMPVPRSSVFLGAIFSEIIFINFQIIIMFVLGYGILGAHLEIAMLPYGYAILLIFSIGIIGIGLIIASFFKSPEAANGFGMLIHMTLMFISGIFFTMDNMIVFFTPYYWLQQVYFQLMVIGDSFSDLMHVNTYITPASEASFFPIWSGIIVIIAFTLTFIVLGIKIFQKKTSI